jgi:hypothetical protein
MATKKKPSRIQKIRKRLRGTIRDLGVVEKDVAKVRRNLRRFLEQVPKMGGSLSFHKRK